MPIDNNRNEEILQMVGIVNKAFPSRLIYLLGHTLNHSCTHSIFCPDSIRNSFTGHYYLLVIVQEETISVNAIQDKIENNLLHFIPSTVIAQTEKTFFNWLSQGHPFAKKVVSVATLCWEADEIELPFATAINQEVVDEENKLLFSQSYIRARAFLDGASFYKLRKEYKMAAFMIHQATEQILNALMMLHTGLKLGTHNIDKLLRCCSMFCPQLLNLYNKNNGQSKELYTLLNKAYVEARYNEHYQVNGEAIEKLITKTGELLQIFKASNPKIKS